MNLLDTIRFAGLDAVPQPQGIKFGDYVFTEPKPFAEGFVAKRAAVYVILAPDPGGIPRPFRALYFGETTDISSRLTRSHEKYRSWCAAAGVVQLHVAVHYTSCSGDARCAIERALIKQYTPACNEKDNPMLSLSALLGSQPVSTLPRGLSGLYGEPRIPAPPGVSGLSLSALLTPKKR